MRSTLLVLATLGLTACSSGSGNGSSSGRDQGGEACTITLSGAVNKTVSCDTTAGFTINDNLGSLNLTTLNPTGPTEAVVIFTVAGEPQSTTYTWANSKVQRIEVIEDNGASNWKSDMAAKIGSSTLTITSLTVAGTGAEGKLYNAHGSVSATLEGQGSTKGQVAFKASF